MDPRLIAVIVGGIVLLGVALFWVRSRLKHQVKNLKKIEKELSEVLEDRRDVIPYLIESYREVVNQPADQIQAVIEKRAETRDAREFKTMWNKEQELEALLEGLFNQTRSNQALEGDIGWLEARTEIQKTWEEVNEKETHYQKLTQSLQAQSKRFPYSIFRSVVK